MAEEGYTEKEIQETIKNGAFRKRALMMKAIRRI